MLYDLTVQGCLGMPVALIEQRLRDDLTTNLLAVEKAALKFTEGPAAGALKDAAAALARDWPEEEEDPVEDDDADMKELNEFLDEE